MATAAQITANQANAHLSTGPVTPEGKARVSQNALRHGLTARHLVIREDDRPEFESLHHSLLEELAPQGAIETATFHELLHAAWNLQRFRRIETELSSGSPDDLSPSSPNIAALDRLGRYQARAQRAYYRAIKELRTLQTNRALRAEKLEDPDAPEVPAITDINELTKQTHSEVIAESIKQAINMVDFEAKMLIHDAVRARRKAHGPSPLPADRMPNV
jgi:hypothetical protein